MSVYKGRPSEGRGKCGNKYTCTIDLLQICLQVQGKGDALASFDGFFDLKEQAQLRDDCTQLVGRYSYC
jgi:hypothetical protein